MTSLDPGLRTRDPRDVDTMQEALCDEPLSL